MQLHVILVIGNIAAVSSSGLPASPEVQAFLLPEREPPIILVYIYIYIYCNRHIQYVFMHDTLFVYIYILYYIIVFLRI